MGKIVLHDYWRSSACYRVRIALNLKSLKYDTKQIDLVANAQKSAPYRQIHPQGIVPAIDIDGITLTQSLAIIEYLDQTRPARALLPTDAAGRARVRAMSYAIAMEIHPLCNSSVVAHVEDIAGQGMGANIEWMHKYIFTGLKAFENYLGDSGTGRYCHGDGVSMADCCLVPQIYNARRWGVDISGFDKILSVDAACALLPEFERAIPENMQTVIN